MSSGSAYGAVTIINATATGLGASLAIEGGVTAEWNDAEEFAFVSNQDVDDRLARAVHEIVCRETKTDGAAKISTHSTHPPARGLKTSSAAAAAMLQAGLVSRGAPIQEERLVALSVEASKSAGVTITGAWDDQIAVVRGGCHLVEAGGRIVQSSDGGPWEVAVWVPDSTIAKSTIADLNAAAAVPGAQEAVEKFQAGDIAGAMTANGRAFHALYAAAGLPVNDAPARAALATGALGAGLSGTGPAVAALFPPQLRPELPVVPGGQWTWTRTVEETQ